MKILNSLFAGWIAFSVFGFIAMAAIFAGGAFVNNNVNNQATANNVMYVSFAFALILLIISIIGQVRFWCRKTEATEASTVWMMYSGLPGVAVYLAVMFFTFNVYLD